ncbi:ArsR/SmtB family transcription factor [Nesterenkonia populi]
MDDAERLESLEQRVTALEGRGEGLPQASAEEQDTFWALDGLRARVPEPGGVMMVGSVQTPKGAEARWQMAAGADELFSSDFAERAESLSALGHPARLRIIQRLMSDAETVQDLTQTGEFGTSGQIYHHLRQLTSHGWLRAAGGGRYEVPAARAVPLLTILLGVDR